MKPLHMFYKSAVCLCLTLATAAAMAQSSVKQSFDMLKSFAGTWEGKTSDGHPVQIIYRLTAGGSALMSEIQGHGDDMITMFHMDGDRLMMTHYCGAGNQPRMKAVSSPENKTVAFEFLDATNLTGSFHPGHMNRVVFTSVDADHHTEDWYFIADGRETHEQFQLLRKQ